MQILRHSDTPETTDFSGHEIVENDWLAGVDEYLITNGVESCAVVALYDPKSRIGYLGHFTLSVTEAEFGCFNDMVDDAREVYDGSQPDAWVGGSTLLTPELKPELDPADIELYNELIGFNRRYITRTLGNITLINDEPNGNDWLGNNQRFDLVRLDPAEAKIEIWTRAIQKPAYG